LHESPVLVVSDPPLHKRQRSLVSLAFTPRRVKLMEPEVRRVATALTDAALASDRMDFVRQFAVPLPLSVIAGVLGVPDERLLDFKRWSDAFTRGVGSLDPTFEQIEALFYSVDEFYDYFTEQLEMRRTEPRDDLLTDLLSARMDGAEPLSLDEMLQMISQFLVGGNETTTSLLGFLMQRLATDPDLLTRVQADYDLLVPLAEEMLRLEPPVQGTFRIANADVEIAGVPIPAGSMLWLVYGSANRDSAGPGVGDDIVWDGASNRQHLSFGRGEHYCLGAAVARLEVRVGMEVLLSRLQHVTLDSDALPPMMPSFVFHGLAELPLCVGR
jgi:cytochrome P450